MEIRNETLARSSFLLVPKTLGLPAGIEHVYSVLDISVRDDAKRVSWARK